MSEKPHQNQPDGKVINFPGHKSQEATGPAGLRWAGTDLARFAEDVIALNRQSSLTESESSQPRCRVASLQSMRSGIKIKIKPAEDADPVVPPTDLSRLRKE